MKFIVSVVILALAVCSEAGYLPAAIDLSHGAGHWGGAPWGAAPWGAASWGGHWGAAPWAGHAYGPYGPSLTTSWGHLAAPLAAPYAAHGLGLAPLAHHGPTTAVHADPLPHGHDGKYVAANRGSVHVAPLTGHIQSVSSTNLQPAPGTTW